MENQQTVGCEVHEAFMRRAIAQARNGWGNTHPNPMVGAVIVEEGRIVAEGFHAKAGEPHAEIMALRNLGRVPAAGATLYVTLEPCSTTGRTGPCTEAIITSGIRRVVIGAKDPNPAHAGRAFEILRAAGVEVIEGVLAEDCTDLNLIFNHWITRDTPLIAAKMAVTLDGKIATRSGDSKWITGEAARADVHRWRRLFPAIAVGAGTLTADNPRLTSRTPEGEWCPIRFVFDGLLRSVLDKSLPQAYTDEFKDRTIVVTTPHGGMGYVRKLQALGVQVWCLPSPTMRVSMDDFRKRCREAGITGVYFEGGSQMVSELIQQRQLDYQFVYHAPIIIADERSKAGFRGLRGERLDQAVRLAGTRHATFGSDYLIRGHVAYPERLQVDETTFPLGGAV